MSRSVGRLPCRGDWLTRHTRSRVLTRSGAETGDVECALTAWRGSKVHSTRLTPMAIADRAGQLQRARPRCRFGHDAQHVRPLTRPARRAGKAAVLNPTSAPPLLAAPAPGSNAPTRIAPRFTGGEEGQRRHVIAVGQTPDALFQRDDAREVVEGGQIAQFGRVHRVNSVGIPSAGAPAPPPDRERHTGPGRRNRAGTSRVSAEQVSPPSATPTVTPGSRRYSTRSADIRFAVRLLWKSPGFTAVAVATWRSALAPTPSS